MAKKPKAQMIEDGTPILKTNQCYLKLHSFGMLNEKGRSVMSLRMFDRFVADPDRALCDLATRVVGLIANGARYSSFKARQSDLKTFQRAVASLRLNRSGAKRKASPRAKVKE